LRRADVLDIVCAAETDAENNYFFDIHDYEDAHDESVREFIDLLGIEMKPNGSTILLPFRIAVGSSVSAIHVQVRSAYDVLRELGSGIEIPLDHEVISHAVAGIADLSPPVESEYTRPSRVHRLEKVITPDAEVDARGIRMPAPQFFEDMAGVR